MSYKASSFILPEDIRYLDFCEYMTEIYGPHWATRKRLNDPALDKMDLAELERRRELSRKAHQLREKAKAP